MSDLSRRQLLASAALAGAAAALPHTPSAWAAAPRSGPQQNPGFYRFKVGDFEVTAINDGTWFRKLNDSFVRNAPMADVQNALAAAFLPTDALPVPFTALIVNTGPKLIAFDTGTGGQFGSFAPQSGTYAANLAAAGIDPKNVDDIYISHFHPDHINGLKTKDNERIFPNATVHVPAGEWDFWMDDANMGKASDAAEPTFKNARRIFGDMKDKVDRFNAGKDVEKGVTSIPAPGHTPGHTVYAINSGNQSLLFSADTAFNPWVFVRHPEWEIFVDMNGDQAVTTRKRLFDMAAADRLPTHGYHWPFPGSGYLMRTGTGYELVPVMWQAMP